MSGEDAVAAVVTCGGFVESVLIWVEAAAAGVVAGAGALVCVC